MSMAIQMPVTAPKVGRAAGPSAREETAGFADVFEGEMRRHAGVGDEGRSAAGRLGGRGDTEEDPAKLGLTDRTTAGDGERGPEGEEASSEGVLERTVPADRAAALIGFIERVGGERESEAGPADHRSFGDDPRRAPPGGPSRSQMGRETRGLAAAIDGMPAEKITGVAAGNEAPDPLRALLDRNGSVSRPTMGENEAIGSADAPPAPAGGRIRMEMVHRETHFAPTFREAVMVESAGGQPDKNLESDAAAIDFIAPRSGGSHGAAAEEKGERRERGEGLLRTLAALSDGERNGAGPTTAPAATAAPAVPASALAIQAVDRIVDGFAGAVAMGDASRLEEAHLRLRAGGAAMKTLLIQLQPEHLGTLEVTMRLEEGRLALEIAASSAETARSLAEDRGSLRGLLERAGFAVDEASISVVARESAAGPSAPGSGRDANGQSGGSFERSAGHGDREGHAGRETGGERRERSAPEGDAARTPFTSNREERARGVFL